ncbi:MAG TPA: YidB family protein [Methylocystis sp.]|nr:YidB family protein [Methylocystis sp.]
MGLLDGVLGGAIGAGAFAVLNHYVESHGGVDGVIAEFENSGYGQQVKSWVGDGANLPINAEDIKKVLGSEKLKQIAASTGLPIDEVAKHLADHLPTAVDKSTPGGVAPSKA